MEILNKWEWSSTLGKLEVLQNDLSLILTWQLFVTKQVKPRKSLDGSEEEDMHVIIYMLLD